MHVELGWAILVAIAGWRLIFSQRWLPRTWMIMIGVAILFVWGAASVPGLWFGGLRDFSYAALQFAAILVVWTGLVARAIAVNQSEKKTAATAPRRPAKSPSECSRRG